jgi:hypothetical protein
MGKRIMQNVYTASFSQISSLAGRKSLGVHPGILHSMVGKAQTRAGNTPILKMPVKKVSSMYTAEIGPYRHAIVGFP